MKSHNLFLSLCLSLIPFFGKAQFPGFKMGGQSMNVGHFYGKLVDSSGNRPIDGATIQLLQNKMDSVSKKKKDVILATVLSDKRGEFSIENLPVMATFKMKISAVGFKPIEKKLNFEMNMNSAKSGDFSSMLSGVDKDLGNIAMIIESVSLENVTVTASKSLFTLSADKKIYNVEKDLSVAGGTALDVMKNVPSVNVDADGNVSMRNESPQIFVDGRPTTLTLDQIPADQIASVEIISNPSAKYDASGGGAGILNVVLKKNRKTGYNGNARASVDSRGKPGGGGDFNFRQNKVNFSLAGMMGFRRTIVTGSSNRTDYLKNGDVAHLNQTNKPIGNGQFRFIRTGIDFFVDNRNTITINGNIGGGNFKNRDELLIGFDTTNGPTYGAVRNTYTQAFYENYGSGISYKHNFSKSGKEWTADANLNYSKNRNQNDFAMNFDNNSFYPNTDQRAMGNGSSRFYTVQSDYADPITSNKKIETGVRLAIRNFGNKADNYIKAPGGNYSLIPNYGTNYRFDDLVAAAYFTYSHQLKKLNYQLGLRVEHSDYTGYLPLQSLEFNTRYPLSWFPSLNMTFKLSDKKDLQFNFSRKINRPNFFQLMPFYDSTDILNISVGNPGLRPEFTHLAELTYSLQYGKNQSLLLTAYGKMTEDLITRYQYKDGSISATDDSVLVTTYGNANKSYNTGLEITAKNKLAKWWDLSTNLNLNYSYIQANNLVGTLSSDRFSWFAKLNNNFKLPKNYSIQINGDYTARALLPAGGRSGGGGMFFGGGMMMGFGQNLSTAQGYTRPVYSMDISIKKEFLKNNAASLTLQCSDVFRTREISSHSESVFFSQDNYRLRDPQVFRLSFNWRFGKLDVSLFKRKNLKGEMENMQNMQGIMAP